MIKRIFIPGSEWLFFKIYTGHKTSDSILVNFILPMVKLLRTQNSINKWFFVRYNDPDFHIRIRFQVANISEYSNVFEIICSNFEKLVENRIISKIQCDSYTRELERYGGELIETSETFFFVDSIFIIQLLERLTDCTEPDQDRWCISLRLIDDILNSFNFTLQNKYDLMFDLSESFKNEFGFNTPGYIKQINDKYRTNRNIIEKCFYTNNSTKKFEPLLKERLEKIKPLSQQITEGYIEKGDNYIEHIKSLIHMTQNRIFRSSNRTFELVIYNFLYRHYKSEIARNKYVI